MENKEKEQVTLAKDLLDRIRQFDIPRSCFILTSLTQHEWAKLDRWNKKKDVVEIFTASNGEVLLLNQTQLRKWHERKQKNKPTQ